MNAEDFRTELERVDELKYAERIEEALELVKQLSSKIQNSSELLIRRATLEQLSKRVHSLDQIEKYLQEACLCSPGNLQAQLELGHFLYAVRDRPADALGKFSQARQCALASFKEAILGEIHCYIEQRDRVAQIRAFAEAESFFPSDPQIMSLRAESKEQMQEQDSD